LTGAFTFTAWFTMEVLDGKVMAGNANDNDTYFGSPQNTTTILVQSDTAVTVQSFTIPTISINTWYHYTVTRDSGNITRVYLNGIQSSSGGKSIAGTFTSNAIGRYGDGAGPNAPYQWQGELDDVRVYNRALSADEIKRLYNGGQ
jgi:hypothetical protein